MLALLDKTLPSVMAAIDQSLRTFGGVPTYGLTDTEKTVTSEHVAGIPLRNAQMLDFARRYLLAELRHALSLVDGRKWILPLSSPA
ncbi:hypothetical protein [Mycobacterium heckeshornense]|uniref:Uncharacterized protein n=1 Tax=Mycobacterium heckeshornense TaxID=110505 RepID=A0A7R7TRR0_9MYCO|nr:hypothetical protein [Mycobacterium heckeshornense]BCO33730.1 hypothetical protein MHEC_01630 [Mycobacterium heckeshornense]BCQ06770.1 hypothetical protein JMUB5695_00179 [Mycobacterium heckeshornense]